MPFEKREKPVFKVRAQDNNSILTHFIETNLDTLFYLLYGNFSKVRKEAYA